ncbi:MAG TPA: hypothetical protein VM888_00180, partial [Chitinophagaceae bacterium]|nr:hypothetical protein [Chitinophagaceae bacterium]
QSGGLHTNLVQQQNSLHATANNTPAGKYNSFLPVENSQVPMKGMGSMTPHFETISEMGNTYTTSETKLSRQLPQKNILFEACMINQPLNASLRDKWSIGTFYFLK